MADWRYPSRTDAEASEPGAGTDTRMVRDVDRFRTPIGGTRAVGTTSRVRRSITGASAHSSGLPPTIEPVQIVCTHCRVAFMAAIRPGLTQAVPCIHCGHMTGIAHIDPAPGDSL